MEVNVLDTIHLNVPNTTVRKTRAGKQRCNKGGFHGSKVSTGLGVNLNGDCFTALTMGIYNDA
jgi:hypothetical protein